MPTPVFICGAECGIAVIGTLSAGTEHWSGVAGTPTVETSGPATMRSTRCYRFNPTAATGALTHTFATALAAPATIVVRFYVYFASLPTADSNIFITTGSTSVAAVRFIQSDSTLRARTLNNNAASGIAVTTGQWYRIDVKGVLDTANTVDIQVDGSAGAQATETISSSTCTGVRFGFATSSTADIYVDDMIASGTSADYPIGAGTVAGLYPASDGGHNFSTAGDFIYEAAGANVATSATDTWTHLQNPLSTTVGNFMNDAAGATSEYLCWVMGNLPASASTVNGVGVCSTHHSASATANTTDVLVVDDSATSGTTVITEIAHLGTWSAGVFNTGVDLSESTITIPYSCAATGASTGAWTVANVNDLAVIFGATDVTPDSYCDGVVLEVDYVAAAAAVKSLVFARQRGTARTTIVR